jgi:hypothetical protein
LLEEEGLLKEAYAEEIRVAFKRFAKGIEASLSVPPLLKTYLEAQQEYQSKQRRNYSFFGGIVFASALFIGSAIILPYQNNVAYGGFAASAITVLTMTFLRTRSQSK